MAIKSRTHRLLETAYQEFHQHYFREKDPVKFVHLYSEKRDQELVALLAASLAYGNVATILKSIRRVLDVLGSKPSNALLESKRMDSFSAFKHRFTTGEDIAVLMARLAWIFSHYNSLESFFTEGSKHAAPKERIVSFVQRWTEIPLDRDLSKVAQRRQRNLKYLISSPENGSACKRLNLFLRWMVRPKDGIDLGLWKSVQPSELFLPIDTHIMKIIKELGWTSANSPSWQVVENSTEKLKLFCASDPIKYDFSLCHLGMEGKRALYEEMA